MTSRWMGSFFAPVRDGLAELHEESRRQAAARGETWAPLDPELPRQIARRMYRRLFSTLSEARHGATIVTFPPERAEVVLGGYISLKHTFADGGHRRRFRDLIVDTMNRLARSHGGEAGEETSYPRAVGWEEYSRSEDRELAAIDEALLEFAHLVAGLAAVDGAVVMTDRGELLGFGGEISGELAPVPSVEKALDPEGEATVPEGAEAVGTATARPTAWRRRCPTPCWPWSPRTAT